MACLHFPRTRLLHKNTSSDFLESHSRIRTSECRFDPRRFVFAFSDSTTPKISQQHSAYKQLYLQKRHLKKKMPTPAPLHLPHLATPVVLWCNSHGSCNHVAPESYGSCHKTSAHPLKSVRDVPLEVLVKG